MNFKLSKLMQISAVAALLVAGLASGAQAMSHDTRKAVTDVRGKVITSTMWGTCVRINSENGYDECGGLSRAELTFFFDFNSSQLNAVARERLEKVATRLKEVKNVAQVRVVGFADRIGSESYNQRLSKARAERVRDFLTKRGVVTAKDVETRFFGESNPKTDCAANLSRKALIACLAPDRRVELEIDYSR